MCDEQLNIPFIQYYCHIELLTVFMFLLSIWCLFIGLSYYYWGLKHICAALYFHTFVPPLNGVQFYFIFFRKGKRSCETFLNSIGMLAL